ncbi:MAG: hypothetical protein AAF430_18195 [Myxococcota bacterium]
MTALRIFLVLATTSIYMLTVVATTSEGPNWPAVAIGDLMALGWRAQFDLDFVVYLILFAVWVAWREGGTPRGYALALLSFPMGGMFGFPYVLYATFAAKGDPRSVLLGKRATNS